MRAFPGGSCFWGKGLAFCGVSCWGQGSARALYLGLLGWFLAGRQERDARGRVLGVVGSWRVEILFLVGAGMRVSAVLRITGAHGTRSCHVSDFLLGPRNGAGAVHRVTGVFGA